MNKVTKKIVSSNDEKVVKSYVTSAVGRRKTSVARVYVEENGNGQITINKRDIGKYFLKGTDRYIVTQPIKYLKLDKLYNFKINVFGGGTTGQSGAIRLGISRALLKINSEFRSELKKLGFLTRDSRKVERKKAGLAGARKSYQFSKR